MSLALFMAGCAGGNEEALPSVHTTPATPTTTVATSVVATTRPLAQPATTVALPGPEGGARFDYRSVAVEEVASTTPMGTITWLRAGHVPGDWLDREFPSLEDVNAVTPQESAALDAAFASAPCCLSVFPDHSGGFIGVGATGPTNQVAADLGAACPAAAPAWSEVWYSPDGTVWEQRSPRAFGAAGIDACLDGPWLLAAGSGALILQFASRALPFAIDSAATETMPPVMTTWASDDLITWRSGTLDIEQEGMSTRLTGGVGTTEGWAVFGMRVSEEPSARSESGIPLGPFTVEWAGWATADGVNWESLDAPSIFGEPPCTPAGAHLCGWIQADEIGDAVVAYLRYWDEGEFPRHDDPWILWIGVFEDPED